MGAEAFGLGGAPYGLVKGSECVSPSKIGTMKVPFVAIGAVSIEPMFRKWYAWRQDQMYGKLESFDLRLLYGGSDGVVVHDKGRASANYRSLRNRYNWGAIPATFVNVI